MTYANNSNLYGIYGEHRVESCPLNNLDIAKQILKSVKGFDPKKLLETYGIHRVVGQYHSALEHTLTWILEAEDAHLIQQFCIDAPLSKFNQVKIVPLITFEDVATNIKKVHSIN